MRWTYHVLKTPIFSKIASIITCLQKQTVCRFRPDPRNLRPLAAAGRGPWAGKARTWGFPQLVKVQKMERRCIPNVPKINTH